MTVHSFLSQKIARGRPDNKDAMHGAYITTKLQPIHCTTNLQPMYANYKANLCMVHIHKLQPQPIHGTTNNLC